MARLTDKHILLISRINDSSNVPAAQMHGIPCQPEHLQLVRGSPWPRDRWLPCLLQAYCLQSVLWSLRRVWRWSSTELVPILNGRYLYGPAGNIMIPWATSIVSCAALDLLSPENVWFLSDVFILFLSRNCRPAGCWMSQQACLLLGWTNNASTASQRKGCSI